MGDGAAVEALVSSLRDRLPAVLRTQLALGPLYLDYAPGFALFEVVCVLRQAAVFAAADADWEGVRRGRAREAEAAPAPPPESIPEDEAACLNPEEVLS